VAAPATVSGEPRANYATGQLGRRRKAAIREPGDLPSFVVTHERIGRGEPMEARNRLSCGVGIRVLARGDVSRYREAPAVSLSSAFSASRQTLVLLAVLLACPLQASAAEGTSRPVSLPPVVVTPTRLPTPESEVGSSITVIPSEEIERKQEHCLMRCSTCQASMSSKPAGRAE